MMALTFFDTAVLIVSAADRKPVYNSGSQLMKVISPSFKISVASCALLLAIKRPVKTIPAAPALAVKGSIGILLECIAISSNCCAGGKVVLELDGAVTWAETADDHAMRPPRHRRVA